MIVRISGILSEVGLDAVVIDRDGLGYEVLVCGYALGELMACRGQPVTLHTMEYFEGAAAGGNLIPRLVGFLHPEDRAFFQRFITVKGIGVRRAVKALAASTGSVASSIEAGDAKMLTRLPGIGKRAADQIIAELKGKVADFALGAAEREAAASLAESLTAEQRDALEVMVALGERRADAQRWLERAAQLHPGQRAADEWIRLLYRVRSGSEG